MKTTQDNISPFLEHLAEMDRSPATIRAYRADLTHFQRWFQETNSEPLAPHAVTHIDLRDYREHLLAEGRSPATVNRHLAAIRAWLRWAEAQGLIDWVPQVSGARKQALGPRWLEKRDESRLLREAFLRKRLTEGDFTLHFLAVRDWAMLVILLHTGLRISELAALRLDDVVIRPRSGHLIVHGKGRKQRRVPLNTTAREAIREWLAVRRETIISNPYLFVSQKWADGKPMSPSTIWRALQNIARRAGVHLTPHMLRHTFAKRLLDRGVSMERVAAILGHESLNTTRRYVEPGERDLQEAVEVLG